MMLSSAIKRPTLNLINNESAHASTSSVVRRRRRRKKKKTREEDEAKRTQSVDNSARPDPFPKLGSPKINPEFVAYFSSAENVPRKHHVYHAYHHKLTIKTPRFDTSFCQNPSKNKQTQHQKKLIADD
jgi:hypothetical protein